MGQSQLSHEIVRRSVPFVDLKDLSALVDFCRDKKVVMLGESSHGTKEFYEWRSLITAELIRQGFNFIAVEGDWPACQRVDQFIRRHGDSSTHKALAGFTRWPTWMWCNAEMVGLIDWLRERNLERNSEVGFHGLDVYSLYDSIDEVITRLRDVDFALAERAREYFACFDPFRHDEKAYARSLFHFPEGCEREILSVLTEVIREGLKDRQAYFDVRQNTRVVQNAEAYYRSVVFEGRGNSWNIRDRHMLETLEGLFDHYGPESRGIVWAHNSHIGDYRGTDMALRGQVNLGGLAREKFGKDKVGLVGFTTYTGSVVASHAWAGPVEVMEVPEAKPGSLEAILHENVPYVGHSDYFFLLNDVEEGSSLLDFRGNRAIGVVYDPRSERRRNYVPTSPALRYDAMVFLDETKALTPLPQGADPHKLPETYPFGNRL